jgi:hypothetical protein
MLCRPEGLEAILGLVPEPRRQQLRAVLAEVSVWPRSEIGRQIEEMRQFDAAEAMRRLEAAGGPRGDLLPPELQRWMCSRSRGSDGREDH